MTFAEASAYVLPWGQHKGKTIDQTAETDSGLRWLDWILGVLDTKGDLQYASDRRELREALRVYLDDETIAGDVAKLTRTHVKRS